VSIGARSFRLRLAGALLVGAAALPSMAALRAPREPSRGLTLALAGDSIVTRPFSRDDPRVKAVLRLVAGADAACTNLETVFHDFEGWAMPSRPSLRSDPRLAEELARGGFDLVSRANNHAGDFGAAGLAATSRHLRAAGLVAAGAGPDLGSARAPGYFRSPHGVVALVSAAATFPEHARAGAPRGRIPGRPGVSPLRFETTYLLPADRLEPLRGVARSLGLAPSPAGGFSIGSARFAPGDVPRVATEPLATDVAALAAEVRRAAGRADAVVISIHAHEDGGDRTRPPEFLVAAARAMIDAGADAVAGHGPHVLRGVEIYRDRPILYGLGNFLFEYEGVADLPADDFEEIGLSPEATVAEYFERYDRGGRRGYPADPEVWESVVALIRFEGERVATLELHPITLGATEPRGRRGEPRIADRADGERILERVAKLSEPYGTRVEIRDGVGIVRVE
jgi:poly-gamma-glutamate synthesis protein (capsule biosynthesis protein)